LGGIFGQLDSTSAELYRAFRLDTCQPKIFKSGVHVSREYESYKKLNLSSQECLNNYIVPIEEKIEDENGKIGLHMPLFACSLSNFNDERKADSTLLEPSVLQGTRHGSCFVDPTCKKYSS
jgi:hypothetical protein